MNSNVVIVPFPPNPIALLKDIIKSRDRATAQESLQQLFNF
ncbi:hypothetical protein PCC7418_2246 [Halothece sp. PCC 7418]|nr:hypothetical protein [Halothece sp. PCC 7418]AFZ44400.1 hypothetical protein PCC7418_2246 [Halothece sp. PCC 7418]